MAGLRPVVELMYMDFALMASDQIANQAAKWHYMSGAQTTVPLVIRASVGAGKGYGGQHSQSLEIAVHPPARAWSSSIPPPPPMRRACSSPPSAPTTRCCSCESQGLYATRGAVPEGDCSCRWARRAWCARVATSPSWPGGRRCRCLTAAEELAGEGIECEVIDLRTLVPLDMETGAGVGAQDRALRGRRQAVLDRQLRQRDRGPGGGTRRSTTSTRRSARVGAANGISPQAEALETGLPAQRRRTSRQPCEGSSDGHVPSACRRPGQMTEECTLSVLVQGRTATRSARATPLFEIETDKSNMEIEAFEEGTLLRIDAPGRRDRARRVCHRLDRRGGRGRSPTPWMQRRPPQSRLRRLRRHPRLRHRSQPRRR